jgi:hypothetical protein
VLTAIPINSPRYASPLESALWFWEIAANVSELSRALQEPSLPILLFFSGCRWITEFVDLPASHVGGL